jgi:AcrR family transcriptional regulator
VARTRDDAAVLAASEACIARFLERGTLRVGTSELAANAGIPERTFFRWFATKPQVLRPVFDWGTDEYARLLDESDAALIPTLEAAFAQVLWGEREERTRGLFPLVFDDTAAHAVFFFAVHDGEHRIVEPLARRLDLPSDSPVVRATAAAVTASLRVALEAMAATGEDPRPVHARMLRSFALDTLPDARATARGPRSTDRGGTGKDTS